MGPEDQHGRLLTASKGSELVATCSLLSMTSEAIRELLVTVEETLISSSEMASISTGE